MVHLCSGDVIHAARRLALRGVPVVLLHVVNDRGGWGRGFVLALSATWPEPEQRYRAWASGSLGPPLSLGSVQCVTVEPGLVVANCCAQHGYSQPGSPAFRGEAYGSCLGKLAERYPTHAFLMPRIGCSLGGMTWPQIQPLVEHGLAAIERVAVYAL